MEEIAYMSVGHIVIDYIRKGELSYRSIGGAVTYGAIAALRYGVSPVIVSKVGVDFPEDYILLLSRYGIDVGYVKRIDKLSTVFELIYENGRRLYLRSLCDPIRPDDVPDVPVRSLHVGTVFHEVPLETVKRLRKLADIIAIDLQGYVRKTDDKGTVFIGKVKLDDIIGLVDIIHGDFSEVSAVCSGKTPVEVAEEFYNRYGKILLLTMGEEGSIVAYYDGLLRVPTYRVRAVNPTGAGDIYTAIFLLTFSEREDVIYSSALATAASSYRVEEISFKGIPTRDVMEKRAKEIMGRIKHIK